MMFNKEDNMSDSAIIKTDLEEKDISNEDAIKEIEFDISKNISFRIALISILVGIGIGGSYALIAIPNVEILSFVIFLAGFLYGWQVGALVGGISEAIFGGFNPNGVAPLIVYLTLVISFTLIGMIGGLVGKYTKDLKMNGWNIYKFAIIGALLTLIFDIITMIGWIYVTPGMAFYLTMIMQVPFTVVHVISNVCLFGLVAIPVAIRVRAFENR